MVRTNAIDDHECCLGAPLRRWQHNLDTRDVKEIGSDDGTKTPGGFRSEGSRCDVFAMATELVATKRLRPRYRDGRRMRPDGGPKDFVPGIGRPVFFYLLARPLMMTSRILAIIAVQALHPLSQRFFFQHLLSARS